MLDSALDLLGVGAYHLTEDPLHDLARLPLPDGLLLEPLHASRALLGLFEHELADLADPLREWSLALSTCGSGGRSGRGKRRGEETRLPYGQVGTGI